MSIYSHTYEKCLKEIIKIEPSRCRRVRPQAPWQENFIHQVLQKPKYLNLDFTWLKCESVISSSISNSVDYVTVFGSLEIFYTKRYLNHLHLFLWGLNVFFMSKITNKQIVKCSKLYVKFTDDIFDSNSSPLDNTIGVANQTCLMKWNKTNIIDNVQIGDNLNRNTFLNRVYDLWINNSQQYDNPLFH